MVTKPGDFNENSNRTTFEQTTRYELVWNHKKSGRQNTPSDTTTPTGGKNDCNQTLTLTNSCFHWKSMTGTRDLYYISVNPKPVFQGSILEIIHTSLQGWKPSRTQQSWLRCNYIYIYQIISVQIFHNTKINNVCDGPVVNHHFWGLVVVKSFYTLT